MIWGGSQICTFACGYAVVPAPFFEKTCLSSGIGHFVKDQLTINIRVSLWTIISIPLICIFFLCRCHTTFQNKFWNQEVWVHQLHCFSRLGILCPSISMWILGTICHFLQKSHLRIRKEFHWIYKSIWEVLLS